MTSSHQLSTTTPDNALSTKERNLLNRATKALDEKNPRTALKFVEALLKTKPKSGDAVALKGLILIRQSFDDAERAQGLLLCKQGVKLNLDSFTAWRHLSSAQIIMRLYAPAVATLTKAIAVGSVSGDMTPDMRYYTERDLGQMMAMCRQWKQLINLRTQMKAETRTGSQMWETMCYGLCVALQLGGSPAAALPVLDERLSLSSTLSLPLQAELLLYKAQLLEEAGEVAKAISLLTAEEAKIIDRLGCAENLARMCLLNDEFAEAASRYEALLVKNPENYTYHFGLIQAKLQRRLVLGKGERLPATWSDADAAILEPVYVKLADQFPSSVACVRIPLDFSRNLEVRLQAFLDSQSPQRAPALFAGLKPLYRTRSIAPLAQRLMSARLQVAGEAEKPWVHHYLAKHCDFLGNLELAFDHVAQAQALEPNELDFISLKARLTKHAGDLSGAAELMEQARKMEPADRYLNNKAIKYALRAGRPIEHALSLANCFVRTEDANLNNVLADLHDQQAMWFEWEAGRSALKRGDVVQALKMFHWIEKHFDTFEDDMADFHEFALRKASLRAYVQLQRNDEKVRKAPAFRRMALAACEALFKVHDEDAGKAELARHLKQELAEKKKADADSDEVRYAGMTPTERKLAKKKEKEAREKAEREAKEKEQQEQQQDEDNGEATPAQPKQQDADMGMSDKPRKKADITPDPDQHGFKRFELLAADPYKFAQGLVDHLERAGADDTASLLLACDVALRRGLYDTAVGHLVRASVEASLPELVQRVFPLLVKGRDGVCKGGWRCINKGLGGPVHLSPESLAKLEGLAGEGANMWEPRLLAWLEQGQDADLALAAGHALLAIDTGKFSGTVGGHLTKVVRPLQAALRAREMMEKPEDGQRHLEACLKVWPMAAKALGASKNKI